MAQDQASPAPGSAPKALNPQQQQGLKKATAAGNQQQYLTNHPGVAAHQQKVAAAPGAPAAGAGGQKAGGSAVPPSNKKPAGGQPAPPPGANNATAQKPGQAPRPLSPAQKQQLARATQQGTQAQYLQNHPGVAAHQQKVAAQQAGQPASTGAPATGASGGKPSSPAAQPTPAPTPEATPAATTTPGQTDTGPTTFQQAFENQIGAGSMDKFGPAAWTGADPITTARNVAQQQIDTANAATRARYAASGFGNSAREGIDEATSNANYGAQLADTLAARGITEQSTGLDRLANMFGTAGEQQIQQAGVAGGLNQQLGTTGTGLTAIGANEQQIPGISDVITLLSNFGIMNSLSSGAQRPPKG
jgi:hypothetical protein